MIYNCILKITANLVPEIVFLDRIANGYQIDIRSYLEQSFLYQVFPSYVASSII